MAKRLITAILLLISVIFGGCSHPKQIDKASLAETVTVGVNNGRISYSFYLLTGADKPNYVSVTADSFENACALAKKKYIPNISLSKLELFITDKSIMHKTFVKDINFIAENSGFSPLMYVSLCDAKTVEEFAKKKELPINAEEHIILLKNKNKDVCVNSLSIFNSFFDDENAELSVSYINYTNELKAEKIKITAEK